MKVKARLLCRKGKTEGSIQIVAYYKDQQKEMSLGRKIDSSSWDADKGLAKGTENQMLNVQIRNAIRDITAAIDSRLAQQMEVKLEDVFREVFYRQAEGQKESMSSEITLKGFIQSYIKENPDKIKQVTMNNYRSLVSVMKDFPDAPIQKVDVPYVNALYDHLKKRGICDVTIQTRFKKLRKIISTAITRGLTKEYPFGKGKLMIPSSKAVKRKFLSSDEIDKLVAYVPENASEEKVMLIVKFNLHVGMRIGDIFTLRKEQIVKEKHPERGFVFRLVKTTSKTETDINILLTKQATDQIMESGYQELKAKDLIFPWLKEEDFIEEFVLYKAISSRTAYFNKILAGICEKVGIKKISSHSLRHTFCTTLVSKGVPVPSIAKLVGHTDISTTMIYAQILQEAADDAINVLEG